MLEKPNIKDELIISRLDEEYGLRVAESTFLPMGADEGSAVYRVTAGDGKAYFLKLRKGFEEIIVTVPLFLRSQGIQEIIVPFETLSKQRWVDFGPYTMILYPFIEGKNGFEVHLSDDHKRSLGSALKAIHSVQLPSELKKRIPEESFPAHWRDMVRSFQVQAENESFADPTAAKLALFIKSRRDEINRLLQRTEELVSEIQSKPLELVLCHTDIHGGNILLSSRRQPFTATEELHIVDWDAPLLAPKERDLMFIGGGIDTLWKTKRDEAVFYQGYGRASIDLAVMAYYRYERVIEDLAAYGAQLLSTDQGGADRVRAYERFTGNFEPGQTIEIAERTDNLL